MGLESINNLKITRKKTSRNVECDSGGSREGRGRPGGRGDWRMERGAFEKGPEPRIPVIQYIYIYTYIFILRNKRYMIKLYYLYMYTYLVFQMHACIYIYIYIYLYVCIWYTEQKRHLIIRLYTTQCNRSCRYAQREYSTLCQRVGILNLSSLRYLTVSVNST